jgi:hypothetical protein
MTWLAGVEKAKTVPMRWDQAEGCLVFRKYGKMVS